MQTPRKIIPTVGLLGFGAFGRLIARHLQPHCPLLIHDPDQPVVADASGHGLIPADIAGVAGCDLVILAVPVARLPAAVAALRPHLRAGTIVIDVGSVKITPVEIMLAELPEHVEIIGTHPLFGPQSARDGIRGLKIAICPIRGGSAPRIAAFLRHVLGLRVILTTADAHDREMAMVQGLTHLVAKVLVQMEPLPSRMTTKSFELLMQATEMVRHDAPGVLMAIEQANPHARAVRDRFFALAQALRDNLEADQDRPDAGARQAEPALAVR